MIKSSGNTKKKKGMLFFPLSRKFLPPFLIIFVYFSFVCFVFWFERSPEYCSGNLKAIIFWSFLVCFTGVFFFFVSFFQYNVVLFWNYLLLMKRMNLYDEVVLIYIKVSLNSAILAFIYFFCLLVVFVFPLVWFVP